VVDLERELVLGQELVLVLELDPQSVLNQVLQVGLVLELGLLPVDLGFEAVIPSPLLELLPLLQKWLSLPEMEASLLLRALSVLVMEGPLPLAPPSIPTTFQNNQSSQPSRIG
jgi:hypothetical protein